MHNDESTCPFSGLVDLFNYSEFRLSGSVTIIGDFWQPFCVGKNNGGQKARPRKTTVARGKRHFLDSAWPVKLFARLNELSWCDVRDTPGEQSPFFLAQKMRKNSLNIVTLPL